MATATRNDAIERRREVLEVLQWQRREGGMLNGEIVGIR